MATVAVKAITAEMMRHNPRRVLLIALACAMLGAVVNVGLDRLRTGHFSDWIGSAAFGAVLAIVCFFATRSANRS